MTAQQLYDELGELIQTYRAGDREVASDLQTGGLQMPVIGIRISKVGDWGWISADPVKYVVIETEAVYTELVPKGCEDG